MVRVESSTARPQRLLLLVCLLGVLGLGTPLGAQTKNPVGNDVAVVVHPDIPLDNLTLAELRRLVLGDRGFWPASVRVTLLLRAPVAHERDVILRAVCQMTEAQFRQHWIGKVFRADTAVAPKIVYSSDMSVDMVARIPGAITFVDASQVGRNVKVLKIDGLSPSEKGYVLR
jgi:ABC-type phosphate transport system substrate-binding protein